MGLLTRMNHSRLRGGALSFQRSPSSHRQETGLGVIRAGFTQYWGERSTTGRLQGFGTDHRNCRLTVGTENLIAPIP